ncbi:MAG: hypothetical protein ACRDGE_12365 [Candidatus Limnocylindria bacterium]
MSHVGDLLARDREDLSAGERRRIDEHVSRCAECRSLQAELARADRLLSGREAAVAIPSFAALAQDRGRARPLALAAAGTLVLLLILALAPILGGFDGVAEPSPTVEPSPTDGATASPGASPTPSAPLPPGTHENPVLGYRITLPEEYRLQRSNVIAADGEQLGHDSYTPRTEAEEREECLQDAGDLPDPDRAWDVRVSVYRDVEDQSLEEWAGGPSRRIAFTSAESTTIDGHEAARLVQEASGETVSYFVRANGRIYEITRELHAQPPEQPAGWLDGIAATFRAIEPEPFPTPTAPARPPREAAGELAQELAAAFAGRDADAVERLMPDCRIGVFALLDGEPQGGALNRSVARFIDGLRERFAAGDLTVTVDTEVRVEEHPGGESYFVVSEWVEPDRTTRIDLFLSEFDGEWRWHLARHHYRRADMVDGCIPFGSPWVDGPC